MGYFTRVVGVLPALALGIINVMWYEAEYAQPRGDETLP
ncbi:MAG: cytochrome bd oxidase small subunit, CydX/CbdX family [Candidatus Thiodiazotropha lotti]|nr:cytochrome bd oxidase small subunit, CydX/CbdX family [Candidatus Thiodiazotropha endoloripes]MCG7914470.1 cytochrome bd oxidase small subunit, CydX/CbdX family [Candidatus Thiodiazotropha weberae]MCG7993575.1 cytochrome bd oxidase small subunit, CydX/CbdX family [Candidatus Thiodiazotropha lotti]MCG7997906.1 cytochrome bd oxidase small subunit, CydX/CbdX family [Candidatus Thiodiazotropha lotti]MCW4185239.1 cytochrome bd oxidase small subunit, CydX/CbdX family [Candidatus Thiodiazotropha we